MSKTPFDAQRGKSLLMFDPDDLKIDLNPKSPLYQRRGEEPPDEEMVASIRESGVIEPILIVRGKDGKPWVAAGARRTINAREANKQLRKARQEAKLVPCVFRDEKIEEGISLKIIENAQRKDLSISQRAEESRLALAAGYSDEQVARWFGVTVATIDNWRVLANSHKDVQVAVDSGTVRLNDAVRKLAKLPEDEQPAALKVLQKEKPTREGKKKDREATGSKGPIQVSPMRRFKKLCQFVSHESTGVMPTPIVALLEWIGGEESDERLAELIPDFAPFIEGLKSKSKGAKTEKAA